MVKFRSRTAKAGLAVAAAVGITVGFAGSASANVSVYSTAQTKAGYTICAVSLLIAHDYNGDGHDYAAAEVWGGSDGGTCAGNLARSTDGGKTWTVVSGTHYVVGTSNHVDTAFYYDGPGYMSKATTCVIGGTGGCVAGAQTKAY